MKRILLFVAFLATAFFAHAQSNEITLVVSGEGPNKTDATAIALRSAIEQAYGTFVSANTEILNDEIVRDEIATVASGNIKSYKEISSVKTPDGYNVTVQAVVSIGKLIEYSKSHGSSAEFAGQTFAMNIKMRKLNTENELVVMKNLREQVRLMAHNAYDFQIEIEEPVVTGGNNYRVRVNVMAVPNSNYDIIKNLIDRTLQSLSLSSSEAEKWKQSGMKTTILNSTYILRNPARVLLPIFNDIHCYSLCAQSSWKLVVKSEEVFEYERDLFPDVIIRDDNNHSVNKEYLHSNGDTFKYKVVVSSVPWDDRDINIEEQNIRVYSNTTQPFIIDFYFDEMELSTIRGFEVKKNEHYYQERSNNKVLNIFNQLVTCKIVSNRRSFLDPYIKISDFTLPIEFTEKIQMNDANDEWQRIDVKKYSMRFDVRSEMLFLDNMGYKINHVTDWKYIISSKNRRMYDLQIICEDENGKPCVFMFFFGDIWGIFFEIGDTIFKSPVPRN